MSTLATTTLSSRGQVVIPEEIRKRLGLEPGAQFVVVADGDTVIFKLVQPPPLADLAPLLEKARLAARRAGMRREKISEAVEAERRGE